MLGKQAYKKKHYVNLVTYRNVSLEMTVIYILIFTLLVIPSSWWMSMKLQLLQNLSMPCDYILQARQPKP